MPIYEYHCADCNKDHEIMQKISEKPLKKCPDCGGKVEKKLSLAGFQLKGGGWYKDGYSSAPSSSATSSEKKTESPKAETKPEKSEKKVSTTTSKT